jgi:UDP-N-acetylmuramoylalanine--D-glutamate ligase
VAIQSFDSDIVLITGGSDKGIGYELLIDTILKSTVKSVICIGTTGKQIAEGLEKRKNDKAVDYQLLPLDVTMPQIVDLAKAKASPGNIVLLSSASASFDMFKDYKDRGNQFKAAVQALATAA